MPFTLKMNKQEKIIFYRKILTDKSKTDEEREIARENLLKLLTKQK